MIYMWSNIIGIFENKGEKMENLSQYEFESTQQNANNKKFRFIKQCKNTRDSSTRRVLVMRHVLVEYELHEDFSKHIGKLVCRHGAKPCNKETELLGTLKASMTTTQ